MLLAINFNSPYKATSIVDFWKRWHITLTRFFTRYIYIPLGGSRKGAVQTSLNILIVFLISGIWHGANWTFVLWGCMNGVAMVGTRLLENKICIFSMLPSWMRKVLSWGYTFLLINLLWVLFRSRTIGDAVLFYHRLFAGWNGHLDWTLCGEILPKVFKPLSYCFNIPSTILCIGFFVGALGFSIRDSSTLERIREFRPTWHRCIFMGILLAASILSLNEISTFLYWDF